jgi:hypothetical protein
MKNRRIFLKKRIALRLHRQLNKKLLGAALRNSHERERQATPIFAHFLETWYTTSASG